MHENIRSVVRKVAVLSVRKPLNKETLHQLLAAVAFMQSRKASDAAVIKQVEKGIWHALLCFFADPLLCTTYCL